MIGNHHIGLRMRSAEVMPHVIEQERIRCRFCKEFRGSFGRFHELPQGTRFLYRNCCGGASFSQIRWRKMNIFNDTHRHGILINLKRCAVLPNQIPLNERRHMITELLCLIHYDFAKGRHGCFISSIKIESNLFTNHTIQHRRIQHAAIQIKEIRLIPLIGMCYRAILI